MAHLIFDRGPDLVLTNKEKRSCHLVDFAITTGNRMKIKENEKIDKILEFYQRTKKAVEN